MKIKNIRQYGLSKNDKNFCFKAYESTRQSKYFFQISEMAQWNNTLTLSLQKL